MKTLVDIVAEATEFLDASRSDDGVSKEDLCDSMRNRLSVIVSKLVSYPVCTNFSIPVPGHGRQANDNQGLASFFNE